MRHSPPKSPFQNKQRKEIEKPGNRGLPAQQLLKQCACVYEHTVEARIPPSVQLRHDDIILQPKSEPLTVWHLCYCGRLHILSRYAFRLRRFCEFLAPL